MRSHAHTCVPVHTCFRCLKWPYAHKRPQDRTPERLLLRRRSTFITFLWCAASLTDRPGDGKEGHRSQPGHHARIREGILVNTAFYPNVKPATILPREASSPRPLDGAGVGPSFTAASSVAAVAAAITTAAAVASVSDSLVGTSDLIGRFVRKLFGEDLCEGRLASLDASTRFYLVEYKDEDAEEL